MRKILVFSLVAMLLGALTSFADFRSKAVQPIVLMILIFTFVFGFWQPRWAWLWALLIGGGVPAAHFLNLALGFAAPYPVMPNVFGSLIALIPAFVGAYSGVVSSWLVQELRSQGKQL
jgi:NO-binding membrane sensor protein with MHYT domain